MIFLYCLMSFTAGMIAMAAFFFAALFNQHNDAVNNVVNSINRAAKSISQEKGAILYPKTDETIAMEEMFERNDKKGEDTEIGKIDEQVP